MQLLKDRIRKDGKIRGTEVLKVDSFLNHQMDAAANPKLPIRPFQTPFSPLATTVCSLCL